MPAPRDRGTLLKAARMYFLDGRSQDDVAHVLGVSRSNVSRMLSAARAQGIVEIRVHDQASRDLELERALRDRFDLETVRVAAFNPGANARASVGDLAARWLDEALQDGNTLALSWGTTLQAMVEAVHVDQPRNVEVVPLVGGLSSTASLTSGQELVRELALRLGATYRYLHAPALLHSRAARDALLAEPAIQEALQHALAADIAIVGIGTIGVGSSSRLLEDLHIAPEEKRKFLAAGPVGDVCCRYYSADGRQITGGVDDYVLAISLDQLRAIPTVVGVAAGAEKAPGVLGALHGGVIRGLALDASLGHAILAQARSR
jgi:DNA-binding transcriptional regulator LsrR (DeoR family)